MVLLILSLLSKDPIFLDFQSLFETAFERKFPGILIRERTNPEKLTPFLGLSKSSAYFGKFTE